MSGVPSGGHAGESGEVWGAVQRSAAQGGELDGRQGGFAGGAGSSPPVAPAPPLAPQDLCSYPAQDCANWAILRRELVLIESHDRETEKRMGRSRGYETAAMLSDCCHIDFSFAAPARFP